MSAKGSVASFLVLFQARFVLLQRPRLLSYVFKTVKDWLEDSPVQQESLTTVFICYFSYVRRKF